MTEPGVAFACQAIVEDPAQAATLAGRTLTLGPNGFCHLSPAAGKLSVTD